MYLSIRTIKNVKILLFISVGLLIVTLIAAVLYVQWYYALTDGLQGSNGLSASQTLDPAKPTAKLLVTNASLEASVISKKLAVSAVTTDDKSVTKVEYLLDGKVVATSSPTVPDATIDTSQLKPGTTHTLQAISYDADGNTGVSAVFRFTVTGRQEVKPADKTSSQLVVNSYNTVGGTTVVPSTAPSSTPSTSPSSSPSSSPSTSVSPSSASPSPPVASRDPLKWPFASDSIWNMPIGSGAQFVSAGLSANPGSDNWTPMPQIDEERIILKPTAPMTQIRYSNAGWSGANRCGATNSTVLKSVPIPTNYVVPNTNDNEGATFLMPDGRTLIQSQPFARCTAGGYATSLLTFAAVDLYGDGITGAHGGSRMSSFGGSIRVGELRPGQQGMKHAIKLNVDSPQQLYRCTTHTQCFRWPSQTADSGAVGDYGTQTNNQNTAMKMGSLLAIPGSVDINNIGLESVPGKQMAWTLQNYGAYIVDSTGGPAYGISAEDGPDGSVATQFKADYGYDLEARISSNTAWSRDFQRLVQRLMVVNNNSPTSIGGGGTPRQPLAPAI